VPRKALILEQLVAVRRFDEANHRHRRALDQSGPLADPELERARQHSLDLRGVGARACGPPRRCGSSRDSWLTSRVEE
jgi:hypothetical protein